MAALKLAAFAFALAFSTHARAGPVDEWRPYIAEASARFGIPADWIERVMRAESGGRSTFRGVPVTSSAGAMGLMQLMPGTWNEMRSRLGLGNNPHHPRDNILAGTFYLRLMYQRFGHPGMYAAYNAGPGRYAAYLEGRGRLPGETVAYLQKVTGEEQPPINSARRRRQIAQPPPKRETGESNSGVADLFFIQRHQP